MVKACREFSGIECMVTIPWSPWRHSHQGFFNLVTIETQHAVAWLPHWGQQENTCCWLVYFVYSPHTNNMNKYNKTNLSNIRNFSTKVPPFCDSMTLWVHNLSQSIRFENKMQSHHYVAQISWRHSSTEPLLVWKFGSRVLEMVVYNRNLVLSVIRNTWLKF